MQFQKKTKLKTFARPALPEVEKGEDVGVPRLQVHGKRALALATPLQTCAGRRRQQRRRQKMKKKKKIEMK